MLLVQSLQMVDTSNVTVAWTITPQSSKVNLILFIEQNSNDSKTIQSIFHAKGGFFQLPGIPIAIVHGFSRKTVIPLTSSETIGKLDFHFSLPACRFSCSWTAVFTGAPFKKVTSQKQGRIKWFTSLQTFSRVCYNQEHVWFHGFSLSRTKIHGNLRYGRSQVFSWKSDQTKSLWDDPWIKNSRPTKQAVWYLDFMRLKKIEYISSDCESSIAASWPRKLWYRWNSLKFSFAWTNWSANFASNSCPPIFGWKVKILW